MSKSIITSKKQKFVGYKELIDPETGEAYPMQMNVIEDRDFNFHKVWLQHLVNGVDGIVNQKLKLAFWIIDNLNKENQLVMNQRTIAEKSGISYQTVNRTIKSLCEVDENGFSFLQKINGGAYRVNPDIVFKGSHSNRMGVCYEYNELNKNMNRGEK
ncbi:replication/maintenance protein RepL [Clostridium perfringens]|uniref:replication/maintenance protein RepL n=1 Tax=Clostridium perfringens TaxID=1502 RepID=UPI000D711780|nr:replication/maintenance protein RepL [Clostridium perfringens]ELC8346079.1 replication/maintenance protein RepL [Clostridium perfringens]PWX18177.1 replication/maintenance protein [Clostridium perfringens]PWX36696.1 replication/maintenance protein [Clostridium perfringens]